MDDLSSERVPKGPPLILIPSVFWWALGGAFATSLLILYWAFLGSIPVQVGGDGIVMNPSRLFTIHAPQTGSISRVIRKWPETVTEGEGVLEMTNGKIFSDVDGQILEILVAPGQAVKAGETVAWIQKPLERGEGYQIAGVVPYPADQEITVGMEVFISIEKKYLKGKVQKIDPYWTEESRTLLPFSKYFSRGSKNFQNLLTISLLEDAKIVPGTPCSFIVRIKDEKPINQLFR